MNLEQIKAHCQNRFGAEITVNEYFFSVYGNVSGDIIPEVKNQHFFGKFATKTNVMPLDSGKHADVGPGTDVFINRAMVADSVQYTRCQFIGYRVELLSNNPNYVV